MTTIGISGSYGGLNLGDEAILAATVPQLRATLPDVEVVVFSRNAGHTRRHHPVDRVVNPRDALRDEIIPEVERLDLLLLGGGGILYDTEAHTYLREVVIAQSRGIPTFAFAIGIGPLRNPEERAAVRDGLNRMVGITVREISAKRLLEEIGVETPIHLTADPALLLEAEPFTEAMLQQEGIPPGERLIGISVREKGAAAPDLSEAAYHELIAEAADFMVHRFEARVVFVPMERADLAEAHRVISYMAAPECTHVLRGHYRPQQILGLMQHFEMAVGMRLHFLIFGAVAGIPLIALPYAAKVSDFLQSLGVHESSAIQTEHSGRLLARIDRLWDERDSQRARIRARVPELQDMARQSAPLAASVIGLGRARRALAAKPSRSTGDDLAGPASSD